MGSRPSSPDLSKRASTCPRQYGATRSRKRELPAEAAFLLRFVGVVRRRAPRRLVTSTESDTVVPRERAREKSFNGAAFSRTRKLTLTTSSKEPYLACRGLRHLIQTTWAKLSREFFVERLCNHRFNLALASRFKLTPASAASMARRLCVCGGTRTTNLPL